MPRLFTGLEIPSDIGQALATLRGGLPGARWIEPENYHVTLAVHRRRRRSIAHEVASLLGRVRRQAFELRVDDLKSFGGRKPRAIVATLGPAQALIELQAEHERLMQRVGLEPEGRKFTPHVTLARLRESSSRQVADYLACARAVSLAAVQGAALRAVLLARLGRRRALCDRGSLSVGGVTDDGTSRPACSSRDCTSSMAVAKP